MEFNSWGNISVLSSLKDLITTYGDYEANATVTKIFRPFELALTITDEVISILITVAKIAFVFAVLAGKERNGQSFISKKIDEYVNKALGFINNVNGVKTEEPKAEPAPAEPTNS